jgi:hypothetical protein
VFGQRSNPCSSSPACRFPADAINTAPHVTIAALKGNPFILTPPGKKEVLSVIRSLSACKLRITNTTPLCGYAGGCASSTRSGDARATLIHSRTLAGTLGPDRWDREPSPPTLPTGKAGRPSPPRRSALKPKGWSARVSAILLTVTSPSRANISCVPPSWGLQLQH